MSNPLTHGMHLSLVRAWLRSCRTRMDELKSETSVTAQRVGAGVLITSILEVVARLLPQDVQQEIDALVADERAIWEMQPATAQTVARAPDLSTIYGPAAKHADYTIGQKVTFLNVMDPETPQVETGTLLYVCAPIDENGQHLPLCYVVGQYELGRNFPRPYCITARFLLGTCSAAL
jgi:hypothetical protein